MTSKSITPYFDRWFSNLNQQRLYLDNVAQNINNYLDEVMYVVNNFKTFFDLKFDELYHQYFVLNQNGLDRCYMTVLFAFKQYEMVSGELRILEFDSLDISKPMFIKFKIIVTDGKTTRDNIFSVPMICNNDQQIFYRRINTETQALIDSLIKGNAWGIRYMKKHIRMGLYDRQKRLGLERLAIV